MTTICNVRQWSDTTGCTTCGLRWDTNGDPPACPDDDRFVRLSPRLSIAKDEPKRPLLCRLGLHRWSHVMLNFRPHRLCLSCGTCHPHLPRPWTWRRFLAWWFFAGTAIEVTGAVALWALTR